MARYHRRTETTTYSLTAPAKAPALGRLLAEAGTDWGRIGLDMRIRGAIVTLAMFIFWRRGDFASSSPVVWGITACIYAILVLFPLRHGRDSMQFYENGIVFRGKSYLSRETLRPKRMAEAELQPLHRRVRRGRRTAFPGQRENPLGGVSRPCHAAERRIFPASMSHATSSRMVSAKGLQVKPNSRLALEQSKSLLRVRL